MKLFLLNFIRKKNFKLYILSLSICTIFIFLLALFFYNIFILVSNKENNIINRNLILSTTDDINIVKDNLQDIKEIKQIYKSVPSIEGFVNINNQNISIQLFSGNDEQYPDVIIGKKLTMYDKNKIILPNILNINNNAVSSKDMIGKTIALKVNINNRIITKDMEVIGIYKSDKTTNIVYTSYQDLAEIFFSNQEQEIYNSYNIIINKNTSVSDVINKIQDKGYNVTLYDNSLQRVTNILRIIKNISCVTIIFLFIFTFIITYSIMKSILTGEKKDIAILKSVGYQNSNLFLILFSNTLFLTIISFIISFLILSILIMICNTFQLLIIKTLPFSWLIILFIIFIILSFLVNTFLIGKIKKISPITIFE